MLADHVVDARMSPSYNKTTAGNDSPGAIVGPVMVRSGPPF